VKSDTTRAAAAVQIRILRSMSPSRKVALVEDADRTARHLALAGIRLRFPGETDQQHVRRLMDLILGKELAGRVYGSGPTKPAR